MENIVSLLDELTQIKTKEILRVASRRCLFLEELIKEIERHGEDRGVLLEDVLEIVDVSDQRANCRSLFFDDLLLQEVRDGGVVSLGLFFVQSGV